MDYQDYRYVSDNQQNMFLLLRLLILQEQNYRGVLNNRRIRRSSPMSILLPTTNRQSPIGSNRESPRRTSLTESEINETTTNCLYYEIENPINTECAITRETFEEDDLVTQINYCGHIFKRATIRRWFSLHSICPICRHNLRDDLNNNRNNSNDNSSSSTSSSYDQLWSDIRGTLDEINDITRPSY